MTSIERTAYPLLNATRVISQQNLHVSYTLSADEIYHINNFIRTNKQRLHYALQVKAFQSLGYFFESDQMPPAILAYLRKQLGVSHNTQLPLPHGTTLYRHRQSIRNYLGITPWGLHGAESARRVAIRAAYGAAQTLNIPADIINVTIEELRTQRYELPAFSTLRRLVRHVRSRVNRTLYQGVFQRLSQENKILTLEGLLHAPDGKLYSPYQALKQPPKSPRINNFKELIRHHTWLSTLGNMEPFLNEISKPKRLQFAQEAKSLDISNFMDLSLARRYTLIASLIDYTQKKTKDNLAEVFCKTMGTIHKRARAELATLREKNANQTQELAYFVRSILGTFKDDSRHPKTFIEKVIATIEDKGGVDEMTQTCDRVIACHSAKHYPLLWTYFKSRRSALFDVTETIQLDSSTQNDHLMGALGFVMANRNKRSDTLKANDDLNLSFVSDVWLQLVYEGNPQNGVLNRRFFEICVFTYLSYELISGDVFIKGADEFSDYRASFLSPKECQDLLSEESQPSRLPTNADEFIRELKIELTKKAQEFDTLYPNLPDFFIDEKGIPSLKKTPTPKPTPETLELVAQIQHHMPVRDGPLNLDPSPALRPDSNSQSTVTSSTPSVMAQAWGLLKRPNMYAPTLRLLCSPG